ncbi:MAG: lipocalin family protein [Dysgonamonadaceae bacterium]|jgi:hypothetical protein|nr:lipocalin family protein [Dysgonamonadaceae bacterium]
MNKTTFIGTIFSCLFVLSLLSCEKEDAAGDIRASLVGSWQLASVEIDGNEADLTAYPAFVRFQSNQLYQSYDGSTLVRGSWSYENGMLNISTDLPAAYYVEEVNSQTLSLKRKDFNTEGQLSISIKHYQRADNSQIPE